MIRPFVLGVLLSMVPCHMSSAAEFNVRDFGAVGDGTTNDRVAIQKAIDACAAAGGGEVLFPAGRYLTGSLVLSSGIMLNVTRDATLVGSTDLKDYTKALIFAESADRIGLRGQGTIDGQGTAFWAYNKPYEGPPWRGTVQFQYKALRRPSFIRFSKCNEVRVQEIRLVNSPSWTLHLWRCHGAEVSGITIDNPLYGPNTDGIDVNSCTDVTITDCDIKTGDDGIVLKSTDPGHDHPSKNIAVRHCRVWSACNAFKIGTETHDNFDAISVQDCHFYSESDNLREQAISGIAIESVDGARLTNITVSDITISNIRTPIFVRLGHRGGNSPQSQQVEPRVPGVIQNVLIENIQARNCHFESSITGMPGHCVEGITLRNLDLEYAGGGDIASLLDDVPDREVIKRYPEASMFGRLPAYGLYCRHVRNLVLDDIRMRLLTPDPRPMLVGDDLVDFRLKGLRPETCDRNSPVIWLRNSSRGRVEDSVAPAGTGAFVMLEGDPDQVNGIALLNNATSTAEQAVRTVAMGAYCPVELPLVAEVSPGAVILPATKCVLVPPMQVMEGVSGVSASAMGVPASGGRGSGSARCRFSVSVPGTYFIWAKVHAPSREEDSFYLSVDGGSMCLSDVSKLGEWFWDRVRDRGEDQPAVSHVSCVLAAGEHVLKIRNRECNTRIEAIAIIRDGSDLTPETLEHSVVP